MWPASTSTCMHHSIRNAHNSSISISAQYAPLATTEMFMVLMSSSLMIQGAPMMTSSTHCTRQAR